MNSHTLTRSWLTVHQELRAGRERLLSQPACHTGNHEHNAPYKKTVRDILSNATFLCQEETKIPLPRRETKQAAPNADGSAAEPAQSEVSIFGTEFFWPCKGHNPYYDQIPEHTDILISHGPVKGCVDGNAGCPALAERVKQVCSPRVVSAGCNTHCWFNRFSLGW